MRLPRMTVRRWMVLIALIAVGLQGLTVAWRFTVYRQRAAAYDQMSATAREVARQVPGAKIAQGNGKGQHPLVWADYYAVLSRKYKRASARPWLPVGADPPFPDP